MQIKNYSKILSYLVVGSIIYASIILTIILFQQKKQSSSFEIISSIKNVSKSVVGIHVTQLKKKINNNPFQKYWDK